MNDRYQPKHFEEANQDTCNYCHRTPAIWQQTGNEKVCAHCGTRVYNTASFVVAQHDHSPRSER